MSIVEKALRKVISELPKDGAVGQAPVNENVRITPAASPARSDPDATSISPAEDASLDVALLGAAKEFFGTSTNTASLRDFGIARREVLAATSAVRERGCAPLILVTSALPGDGKTYTSLGLSRSLSLMKEFRITLVDADIIRHRTSNIWCLDDSEGLSECIRLQKSPHDVTHRTGFPQLQVIGAGRANDPSAAEELAGDKVASTLRAMAGAGPACAYVIDAPPIVGVAETVNLMKYVDVTVLVVRNGVTPIPAVSEAMDAAIHASKILLLLNGVPPGGGYYYGDYSA